MKFVKFRRVSDHPPPHCLARGTRLNFDSIIGISTRQTTLRLLFFDPFLGTISASQHACTVRNLGRDRALAPSRPLSGAT